MHSRVSEHRAAFFWRGIVEYVTTGIYASSKKNSVSGEKVQGDSWMPPALCTNGHPRDSNHLLTYLPSI